MLEIFYDAFNFVGVMFAVIYMVYLIVSYMQSQETFIGEIAFGIVLFGLKFGQFILSIVIGKTDVFSLICAIIWGIVILHGFLSKKESEERAKVQRIFEMIRMFEILLNDNMMDYNDDVFEELDYKDETFDEIVENSSNEVKVYDCEIVD